LHVVLRFIIFGRMTRLSGFWTLSDWRSPAVPVLAQNGGLFRLLSC
jgi:hypothetical protein